MNVPNALRRAGLAVLACCSLLALGVASASADPFHRGGPAGAVFVQTDGLAGNQIVAYDRLADGWLYQAGTYATGGVGGQLTGSGVDHTASEGSLVLDDGLLYAVNAGSDTVTTFAVAGDRLVRLQTIGSGGDFPVSVTAHGDAVYVLNARGGGSVQGYLRVGPRLIAIPAWHRALGLDPAQTPEFTSTPGQVGFTPDGRSLIVTTKGNGSAIDVFALGPFGGLSAAPVVTAAPGGVPFGFTFDARGNLVVAQAGDSSIDTYALHRNGSLSLIAKALTGQPATCWVTVDGPYLFASNAGGPTVTTAKDPGDGTLAVLGNTTTSGGTVDSAVSGDGRVLYVQGGAAGSVDAFRVGPGGSLSAIGTVTVPGAAGGEGIVAT